MYRNTGFDGGGIHLRESSPIITQTSISNNIANHQGAGIYLWTSSPALDRVSVVGNDAADVGGGIFCVYNSNPSIGNSVLYDNLALTDQLEPIYLGAGSENNVSISYSNIENGLENITVIDNSTVTNLGGVINVDPLFIDADDNDLRILATSQMINSGHPDSLDSDGSRADIGAHPYLNNYNCLLYTSPSPRD